MNFFKDFKLGILSYLNAIRFIHVHKLYWYLPIPALLMLIIYGLGAKVSNWQSSWIPGKGCMTCINMNETVWFLLQILLSISIGLLLMKFAKYIVVIMLSPLFSILSQVVEKKITGKYYPFDMNQTFEDVKRGIKIALRNLMWEYFFFLIILILSFILFDDPTNSFLFYMIYFIGFFYYGFSFLDYINERLRLDIPQSIHFMRQHRGLATAIGSVYSLLIFVPVDLGVLFRFEGFLDAPYAVLGSFLRQLFLWLLASASPILAIVAATLAMDDLVDLKTNQFSKSKKE